MILLHFNGGLGNQLFQYGLYKKYESQGKIVKADLRDFIEKTENRRFYLYDLGIELETASKADLRKFAPDFNVITKIKNRLGLVNCIYDNPTYVFKKQIFDIDNVYVDGYWQCPKYFDEIKANLTSTIKFPALPDTQKELYMRMLKEESVSVHIRLGDYLKFSEKYGNICTYEYYNASFEYIDSKCDKPIYYGFSDNPDMAKKIFYDRNIIWLNLNSEEYAYNDLYLMTACKHNIIANSSFSWWGAYLGQREGKIVVAPSKWTNTNNICDIWCDDWIKK